MQINRLPMESCISQVRLQYKSNVKTGGNIGFKEEKHKEGRQVFSYRLVEISM
jgi:hypothetical protein